MRRIRMRRLGRWSHGCWQHRAVSSLH
jgi:hypothetical protein